MVSVIIPAYNRARYIAYCLLSAIKQTDSALEIIVVDDGSTDNLKESIAPFMDRIKYIRQDNRGAAAARNAGLKIATGDYIAWLDSDDKWFPDKIELELQVFSRLPDVGLVFTDFSFFTDTEDAIDVSYMRKYFHILDQYKIDFSHIFTKKSTCKNLGIKLSAARKDHNVYWGDISSKVILGPMILPSTVMIRRKCIDRVGFFNEAYETAEDYDFHARIAKRFHVCYIDAITAGYRRFHPDQLSSAKMEIKSNRNWLNIALELGREDSDYYARNKKTVDTRISHCYYGLGSALRRNGKHKEALKNFITSVRLNPLQRKIYLFLLLSFFNLAVERLLRTVLKFKYK